MHLAPTDSHTATPAAPNGLATRTDWQIDPGASRVEFSIRKRLFVVPLTVTGRFSDVQGTITLDEQDPTSALASVTIAPSSIDTANAKRDAHLRTADFFHVDRHPAMTFHSRRVELTDRGFNRFQVVGDLTIRGVTREVALDTIYVAAQGSGPKRRMKLTLTTTLNRRDFGLHWNTLLIAVADTLTVNLAIEATPKETAQS